MNYEGEYENYKNINTNKYDQNGSFNFQFYKEFYQGIIL